MIYTAQDVVDYLLTAVGGGAQDGEARAVRQAVVNAHREVTQARNWLWHTKTNSFNTSQYSTVATQISQGSPTITVNSTANMAAGRLLDISANYFTVSPRIKTVNSGTSVTLDVDAKATLTGTTPVLIQTYYDLPDNLRDIDVLVTNTVGTLHCYITPQEWQRLEVNTRGAGEPYYYTIMRSDQNPDRWQIRFVGVPTNGTPVYYTYRYQPTDIKYMGYEPVCRQGTVVSNGATPSGITGTGTNFQSDMVGAMLRVGTTTTEADPIGALRSYVGQGKIGTWTSTTAVTLATGETIPAQAAASVKYAVTDIIDCSPAMYSAILSGAEYWYARIAGKPGSDVAGLYNRDLRLAMERDVVSPLSGSARHMTYPTPRSSGWYSSQLPDQGG